MNKAFLPAHKLAALVRQGKIGCLELLNSYLQRVEQYNPALNAIVVLEVERAKKRARAADPALAKGEVWGPLHGVPMTIKESFDVEGLPTTWGRPDLKTNIPPRSAHCVERYVEAGAVLFGKTNVPALLADWQSFNAIYGTTNNPWDVGRIPGGSSGGAAAALAAGLTGLENGSDIGASIRNPAHYCGVYGHKPTFGICSSRGQVLPPYLRESDMAVIGPMARSAKDLEIALKVIAGPDEDDAAAWQLRLPRAPEKTIRQWKVGVVLDAPSAPVDRGVADQIQKVADFLAKRGAKVSDRARPDFDMTEAHRTFIQLLRAATTRSQSDELFARNVEAAKKVKREAMDYKSWAATGNTLYHRSWLLLNEKRHQMRQKWAEYFADYDLLLCPAAATTAFPHNQQGERWERMVTVNGEPQPSTTQMFWAGYPGMSYLPSTVAPVGLHEGLPVGVQIVGPQYGDLTSIAFAQMLEKEYHGFVAPPGYE